MQKSALQIARQSYQPKMPKALASSLRLAEGAKTESVADQEEIRRLFPNTYGMPVITLEQAEETAIQSEPIAVGVILSGHYFLLFPEPVDGTMPYTTVVRHYPDKSFAVSNCGKTGIRSNQSGRQLHETVQ